MDTPSRRFLNSPSPAAEAPRWSNGNNNLTLKIASNYSVSEPPPVSNTVTFGDPSMGIILIVLLVTFFLMGFFSVYVRRFAFSSNGDPPPPAVEQERGLDRAAINRLPIVTYDSAKREAGKGEEEERRRHEWQWRPDCVVCLTDFQDKETLRLLPKCEHCFHPECIDMWLYSHSTCPLCRRSLLHPAERIKSSSNRGLVITQDEARSDLELETVIHGPHQRLNIQNFPSQNVPSSIGPNFPSQNVPSSIGPPHSEPDTLC